VLLSGGSEYECVGDAVGPVAEQGSEYEVYDTCSEDSTTYVKVYSPEALEYRWIDEKAVECS
jgi:hypothetical protein